MLPALVSLLDPLMRWANAANKMWPWPCVETVALVEQAPPWLEPVVAFTKNWPNKNRRQIFFCKESPGKMATQLASCKLMTSGAISKLKDGKTKNELKESKDKRGTPNRKEIKHTTPQSQWKT